MTAFTAQQRGFDWGLLHFFCTGQCKKILWLMMDSCHRMNLFLVKRC